MTVTKELTKKHENSYEGKISDHLAFFSANEPKGEYVLVIAGRSFEELEQKERDKWEEVSLAEHVKMYIDKGMDKKEAMKAVAADRGISKRDVYNALLEK